MIPDLYQADFLGGEVRQSIGSGIIAHNLGRTISSTWHNVFHCVHRLWLIWQGNIYYLILKLMDLKQE